MYQQPRQTLPSLWFSSPLHTHRASSLCRVARHEPWSLRNDAELSSFPMNVSRALLVSHRRINCKKLQCQGFPLLYLNVMIPYDTNQTLGLKPSFPRHLSNAPTAICERRFVARLDKTIRISQWHITAIRINGRQSSSVRKPCRCQVSQMIGTSCSSTRLRKTTGAVQMCDMRTGYCSG